MLETITAEIGKICSEIKIKRNKTIFGETLKFIIPFKIPSSLFYDRFPLKGNIIVDLKYNGYTESYFLDILIFSEKRYFTFEKFLEKLTKESGPFSDETIFEEAKKVLYDEIKIRLYEYVNSKNLDFFLKREKISEKEFKNRNETIEYIIENCLTKEEVSSVIKTFLTEEGYYENLIEKERVRILKIFLSKINIVNKIYLYLKTKCKKISASEKLIESLLIFRKLDNKDFLNRIKKIGDFYSLLEEKAIFFSKMLSFKEVLFIIKENIEDSTKYSYYEKRMFNVHAVEKIIIHSNIFNNKENMLEEVPFFFEKENFLINFFEHYIPFIKLEKDNLILKGIIFNLLKMLNKNSNILLSDNDSLSSIKDNISNVEDTYIKLIKNEMIRKERKIEKIILVLNVFDDLNFLEKRTILSLIEEINLLSEIKEHYPYFYIHSRLPLLQMVEFIVKNAVIYPEILKTVPSFLKKDIKTFFKKYIHTMAKTKIEKFPKIFAKYGLNEENPNKIVPGIKTFEDLEIFSQFIRLRKIIGIKENMKEIKKLLSKF